ncbi:HotDog domain-containing protein [Lasiosphaeria ovina]|uniref:HotDog domain-containing protein n=1 Tax=Lasiosphaeria ovina TaxID=92902 RepID=A0AAE0JXP5_9PEZI|nr:HotDog domain-containing protein [Lasiosphaeria ovina]
MAVRDGAEAQAQKQSPEAAAAAAAAELAHFDAIPWVRKQIDDAVARDSSVVVEQSYSRVLKPRGEDALVSRTLNRPDAIAGFITLYTPPPSPSPSPTTTASTSTPQPPPPPLVREITAYLTLGPSVNGWAGICHGGIVMTVLDEVMGQLPAVNKLRGAMVPALPLMTAYLNTRFLAPLRTGTTVVATARLIRVDGRKHFMEARICDERGEVLAEADALFVVLRARL